MQNPASARSPFKPMECVSLAFEDPALDWESMTTADLERYVASRDMKDLVLRADARPHLFHVSQMPGVFKSQNLDAVMGEGARQTLAFLVCCHRITLPNGTHMQAAGLRKGACGTQIAPDSWVDEVRDLFAMRTIYEIGQVAIDLAEMSRVRLGPFLLPHGLIRPR